MALIVRTTAGASTPGCVQPGSTRGCLSSGALFVVRSGRGEVGDRYGQGYGRGRRPRSRCCGPSRGPRRPARGRRSYGPLGAVTAEQRCCGGRRYGAMTTLASVLDLRVGTIVYRLPTTAGRARSRTAAQRTRTSPCRTSNTPTTPRASHRGANFRTCPRPRLTTTQFACCWRRLLRTQRCQPASATRRNECGVPPIDPSWCLNASSGARWSFYPACRGHCRRMILQESFKLQRFCDTTVNRLSIKHSTLPMTLLRPLASLWTAVYYFTIAFRITSR